LQQTEPQPARSDDESWTERLLEAETAQTAANANDPDVGGSAEQVTMANEAPREAATQSVMPHQAALLRPTERLEPSFTETEEAEPESAKSLPIANSAPGAQVQPSTTKDRDASLFELEDEPLQLDWETRRRPWGRWLGWGALNLLAL